MKPKHNPWSRLRSIALVSLGGCQLVPLPPRPLDHKRAPVSIEEAAAPNVERGAAVPLARTELRVRLAAYDGQTSLSVLGSQAGTRHFVRVGELIRDDSGETRTHFLIRPQTPVSGLQVEDRHYPGLLVLELHEGTGLRLMNHVEIEDYVAGVVPSELVLWSAEESEIAAQAIAARTYALRSMNARSAPGKSAWLWDDTRDQVYIGKFQPGRSAGAQRVQARYERGLALSRGRVLIGADGDYYDVRFHASCGGTTCSPAEAFPLESNLHQAPVVCEPCRTIGAREQAWPVADERRRKVHWTWTADAASLSELAARLGLGKRLIALRAPHLDGNRRWQSVELQGSEGSRRLSIEALRRELGPTRLKSGRILRVWPAIGERIAAGLFFEGLGRGHGAGLCQIGSHEYALKGWSARQILQHYLPGSRLVALSDSSLPIQP